MQQNVNWHKANANGGIFFLTFTFLLFTFLSVSQFFSRVHFFLIIRKTYLKNLFKVTGEETGNKRPLRHTKWLKSPMSESKSATVIHHAQGHVLYTIFAI